MLLYCSQVNEALGVPVHSHDEFARNAIPLTQKNRSDTGVFLGESLDALFDIALIITHERAGYAQRYRVCDRIMVDVHGRDAAQMARNPIKLFVLDVLLD
nr:hypothetical protein WS54_04485 [Burkholderia sp. NRF60-BP8]